MIDDQHEPEELEIEALVLAVESHQAHEKFGNPYAGGYMEQPVLWRLAVECVGRAVSDARRDASDMADLS